MNRTIYTVRQPLLWHGAPVESRAVLCHAASCFFSGSLEMCCAPPPIVLVRQWFTTCFLSRVTLSQTEHFDDGATPPAVSRRKEGDGGCQRWREPRACPARASRGRCLESDSSPKAPILQVFFWLTPTPSSGGVIGLTGSTHFFPGTRLAYSGIGDWISTTAAPRGPLSDKLSQTDCSCYSRLHTFPTAEIRYL